MDNEFSKRVLEQIEQRDVEVTPRWSFLMKEYVLWALGLFTVALGGLAVAIIIGVANNSDSELLGEAGFSPLMRILMLIPLLWLAVVGVLVLLAQSYIRHTKHGYRYRLRTLLAVVILGSAALGSILSFTEIGEEIDEVFEEYVPLYGEFFSPRHRIWTAPEDGRLVGRIIVVQGSNVIVVETIQDDEWTIDVSEAEILWPAYTEDERLKEYMIVRVVGETNDDEDELFEAKVIKVLPKGKPFGRPRPNHPPRPAYEGQ